MFLLGLCSILQIVFLPGFFLLRALRVDAGVVRTLIWAFALSLVVNHLLVLGLVLARLYTGPVVYGVFALETLGLLWLVRGQFLQPVGALFQLRRPWPAMLRDTLRRARTDRRAAMRLVILTSVWLLVLAYALAELAQFGGIFTASDAVVYWNRWAIDWAQGRIPHSTSEYPQLLPCNYSLTYVFIGDTRLWFFAKAVAFLFCLLLLVGMLDLYQHTGMFGYVLAVPFTYGLLWAFVRFRDLSAGYADIPLAFMATVMASTLIFARRAKDRLKLKYVLLGAVLAGGTALTKQAGLLLAVLYPLLTWLIVYRRRAPANRRHVAAAISGAVLIPLILTVPWFSYKLHDFSRGRDQPVLWSQLQDQHEDRSPLERVGHAESLIEKNIPFGFWIMIVPTLLMALWDPVHRWLVMLVIVPFFLGWSVGFSYETQNLAMIAPLAGMAMGIGVMQFGPVGRRPRRVVLPATATASAPAGRWSLRVGHVLILAAAAAVAGNVAFSRESLLALQLRLQRQVGLPLVNERLYEYAQRSGFHGEVLSDYPVLPWLPELGELYRPVPLTDVKGFREAYEDPAVECALLKVRQAPAIRAYLDEALLRGTTRLEFEFANYCLYRKTLR